MLDSIALCWRKSSYSRHLGQAFLDSRVQNSANGQAFRDRQSQVGLYHLGMEIKDWVKAARKSRGWTGAQLGEQLGRSKGTVGHWETGKHLPSYAQVLKIRNLTGFPLPPHLSAEQEQELQGEGHDHQIQVDAKGAVQWLIKTLQQHSPARRRSIGDALARLVEDPAEPEFEEGLLLLLQADARNRTGTDG